MQKFYTKKQRLENFFCVITTDNEEIHHTTFLHSMSFKQQEKAIKYCYLVDFLLVTELYALKSG